MKETLGKQLIGHISRDGTAIEAREKPAKRTEAAKPAPIVAKKRGRPHKDEIREATLGKLVQQRGKPLSKLRAEVPRESDRGSKCNAQGYKNSWNGYKLHIDTTLRCYGQCSVVQRLDARRPGGNAAGFNDAQNASRIATI